MWNLISLAVGKRICNTIEIKQDFNGKVPVLAGTPGIRALGDKHPLILQTEISQSRNSYLHQPLQTTYKSRLENLVERKAFIYEKVLVR